MNSGAIKSRSDPESRYRRMAVGRAPTAMLRPEWVALFTETRHCIRQYLHEDPAESGCLQLEWQEAGGRIPAPAGSCGSSSGRALGGGLKRYFHAGEGRPRRAASWNLDHHVNVSGACLIFNGARGALGEYGMVWLHLDNIHQWVTRRQSRTGNCLPARQLHGNYARASWISNSMKTRCWSLLQSMPYASGFFRRPMPRPNGTEVERDDDDLVR